MKIKVGKVYFRRWIGSDDWDIIKIISEYKNVEGYFKCKIL